MKLTEHEKRILAYLDQRGPMHRVDMLFDLAAPDSRTAQGHNKQPGQSAAFIVANWCRRLKKERLVMENVDRDWRGHALNSHSSFEITRLGREYLRETHHEAHERGAGRNGAGLEPAAEPEA